MANEVILGEVDSPEGILVIIDPGLARFWRHESDPASPRKSDPSEYDLEIVGPDAEQAGRAYDREFDPLHLYDQDNPEQAKSRFDAFAVEKGYKANAELLSARVPHTRRSRLSLDAGRGLGVVKYNGLWGVVADGLPTDRSMKVIGIPMPEGEFAGRWQQIDVIVDAEAKIKDSQTVEGVMVEHGQLMFVGLSPLGEFRMWESLDGLADFVFWGPDAPNLAKDVKADDLGSGEFGWKDRPDDAIGGDAHRVQDRVEADGLAVAVDYRPHCNLEKMNAKMRVSDEDTAQISLGSHKVVGCGNRWGDGIFAVTRLLDRGGRVARVRVELGTEQRQQTMREVRLRAMGAIVTRTILDDGEPIRFAERMEPNNPNDSGWLFCAGVEDEEYMADSSNFAVVQLQTVLDQFPEIQPILTAAEGAKFSRDGDEFVRDEV